MKNKTCGECKHLNKELAFCRACGAKWLNETDGANCEYFEQKQPPTNGDKIRQMSNKELAKFLSAMTFCAGCPARNDKCNGDDNKVCRRNWREYLNAPAESEVRG